MTTGRAGADLGPIRHPTSNVHGRCLIAYGEGGRPCGWEHGYGSKRAVLTAARRHLAGHPTHAVDLVILYIQRVYGPGPRP